MNDPKQLKMIEQFPDDLKGMLRDLKVPLDDPVISLLAWIWKQMNETKETIDNAKMTVTAVLQERLDKMKQTADLLISTNGYQIPSLQNTRPPLTSNQNTPPFGISNTKSISP